MTLATTTPVPEATTEAPPADTPVETPVETPSATPTPAPTREAVPVETPAGTTGLPARTPGVQYDEACLEDATAGRGGTEEESRLQSTTPGSITAPAPYSAIPYVQDAKLQETLEGVMGDASDSYSFVIKNLATGSGAMHNAGRVFNAASTFKLFIMYEVFHQQSLGLIDWDTELVVTPYYDAFALSPRVTELCQVITVADALDAMLSVSDNAAAVLLQDLVGSGNVNNAITSLGLTDSGLFTEGLPVTAADLALLLESIARSQAISQEASADMLDLMAGEVIDNGLVAGVPPGTVVAHKTGNWSDATHDAGIVFTEAGPYVFVALSQTNHVTSLIQALSSAAYEHFAGAPQ